MDEANTKKTETSQRGRALIYVVDDEPMLLDLAAVILRTLGYTVATFRAPEATLQAYRAAAIPPALLITDYAVGAMNGLELAAACRKICPQQKVLLLSGTVGVADLQGGPTWPDQFLAKPYQPKQLVNAVESLLAA